MVKIDYPKLGVLLLPTFLRGTTLMNFVRVLMSPLATLHDKFQSARDERLYGLHHTSQVCYIKDALNREFKVGNYDMSNPQYSEGFELTDINARGDWQTAYTEAAQVYEDRHLIAQPDANAPIAWNEASIVPPTTAFDVLVPNNGRIDLNSEYDIARIRNIVNSYRLASRTLNQITYK